MTNDALLRTFGPEIWIAEGPVVTATAGFRYPTRMAVIRLADGGLLVWSPTSLTDELRGALGKLGEPRYLVPPNSLHHVFLAKWQSAYPGAKVYAPPGLRQKRKDVRFDEDLGDAPIDDLFGQVEQILMHGNVITTEVVFFHRKSATVLFADLIQQFPAGWFEGWRSVVARLDLMAANEPTVPRKFRVAFLDRRAARASLQRIMEWPCERVLLAHGEPVISGGKHTIRHAFRWLE